ncbi:MAG: tetratricopeptide repeat protein [Pedobacter sp.]|nr:tetratricopeptide repeat protein [Pedobacter sp.]
MKNICTLVFLTITIIACGNANQTDNQVTNISGQSDSYEAWNKEAEKEIRLNPKYGNAVKSTQQKAADEELIKRYINMAGTSRKGAELLLKKGFEYLYSGNLRNAMYRFNQAWLLDSTDANVYSGFASVYYSFKDYKKSIALLDQGLEIDPKASALLTDKATNYLTIFQTSKSLLDMKKGLSLLKESYAIDPLNQNTLYKLSTYYFDSNDCDLSLKYYRECMKLGGQPVVQRYKDAIKERCGS